MSKVVKLEPGICATQHAIKGLGGWTVCGEQIYPGELKRAFDGVITCEECLDMMPKPKAAIAKAEGN